MFYFYQAEHNDQSSEPERPGVIVSNHVSYVDILYHMSASYPSFVAKVWQPSLNHFSFRFLYEILVIKHHTSVLIVLLIFWNVIDEEISG